MVPPTYKPPTWQLLAGVCALLPMCSSSSDMRLHACKVLAWTQSLSVLLCMCECAGGLLDKTVQRLYADETPLRNAIAAKKCTVITGGWDNVGRKSMD
eukprot:3028174-Pleurochrysis_carterae.AAC.1